MKINIKIKRLKDIPKRTLYGFLAILILSSSYLVWWRPDVAHAQTDTFSTPGTFTWNVPANVTSADFEAWGGGGAGGGATTNGTGGGGGAGGQYAKKHATGLVTNAAYTVTVGGTTAGGTGNGNVGSDSFVQDPNPAIIVLAKGGAGGAANGGSPGTGSTTNGVGPNGLNAGGSGGVNTTSTGGGGGGGAGSTGAGGTTGFSTGGTGASLNGGNGGNGGSNANGNPGSSYGGGGGGAGKSNGSSKSGGTGAQGLVTVTYTVNSTIYTQTNYQWFQNDPTSANPSTKLNSVNQNTATTLTSSNQAFRLRQLIKTDTGLAVAAQGFDEQYADLATFGSCSAIPSTNWSKVGSPTQTSSGPKFTSTATGNTGAGTASWSSLTNLGAQDGSTASVTMAISATSKDLIATGFGFSIPTGSTINGVRATLGGARASTNSAAGEVTVSLVKAGTAAGANKATNTWTTTTTDYNFGSTSDLWSTTLTPSDVNNSGFGLDLALDNGGAGPVTATLDSVNLTVYYTPGQTSSGPRLAGTGTDLNDYIVPWTSAGNITAQDFTYATTSVASGDQSNLLSATNFGFNIPAAATISGIQVTVTGNSDSATNTGESMQLIKGGVVQTYSQSQGAWPSGGDGDMVIGSSTDVWQNSWSPSDVNSSNFGFAISAIYGGGFSAGFNIDDISMTITYLLGGIGYKANSSIAYGTTISSTANDPTDGLQTVKPQYYWPDNAFSTRSILASTDDAEWDLPLVDAGAPAGTTYCFRTVKVGNTALDLYSQYPMITTYTPVANSAPAAPTTITPAGGATGVSTTPSFTLRSSDADNDYLVYSITIYQSNCSTLVGGPYSATIDPSDWSGKDANGNTAYVGNSTLTSSTIATFTYPGTLAGNTTYCWSADATDPGGSNTSSGFVQRSFTTGAASSNTVNIQGGVDIRGGTTIQ